jgi:hypothetical protein
MRKEPLDRQQFEDMMMRKFIGTGKTLNGKPVTESDIRDFVDRKWKSAYTGTPDRPTRISDRSEYAKETERKRLSFLARPLDTIYKLGSKYQPPKSNTPWKKVLRDDIEEGEQRYMQLDTPIPFLGKRTRTGIFSLNSAVSLAENVWELFSPFYDVGKLLTYGAVKGDLGFGSPEEREETMKERILGHHADNPETHKKYNDLMEKNGMDKVTYEEYNRIIQEEYSSLMGILRMGDELKEIVVEGYPEDATDEEVQGKFPTLTKMTEYMKQYGSWEGWKLKARDDPFGLVSDLFSVLDPAAAGLKGVSKLATKLPRGGKRLSGILEEVSNLGTSPSRLPFLRHASKLDPARIAIKGTEAINNTIARKYANLWTYLSSTPAEAGRIVTMEHTPRMGEIFRKKIQPAEMMSVYYDAISNVERKMKLDYSKVLDEKFGNIILDNQGQERSFNNVYNEIERLEKKIAKKWRFESENVPIDGAPGQTTTMFDADTPQSGMRKYAKEEQLIAERMLDEVQQLKLEAIHAGKVDANGKPIITFKDLDDLRSALRIQFQGTNVPSGKWSASPVSKIYQELYDGITNSIEKGLKTKHQQVSPDTPAPSYRKDLKSPYATLSRFLENVEATFKVDPKNPFEFQLTPQREQAWQNMYKILSNDGYFRGLLNDEIRNRTGVDLAKDLAAYTFSKGGNATPGIAAARVQDSMPSFFLAMFSTTPETAGRMMRMVGVPRAWIGGMVDFLKIRDMPKIRPLQRAGQMGAEVLEEEQIEKDRVRGVSKLPGPSFNTMGTPEENLRRQLDLMKQGSN